ncbi:MAG: dimethyl sulfoxide reductase anchor subunit family protein [Reyranellaceae bacterium]
MHPAFSVIVFTVASGAGYGLLFVLALLIAAGLLAPAFWTGFIGFGISFGLITAGLLSSFLHLGRPERAWRAFSQWRSSWLSREGVLAVITYVPAGLLALLFTFFAPGRGVLVALGLASAVCAVVTVIATGMIYRSLKPIRAWYNSYVVPGYLALGLATGLLLGNALVLVFAAQAAAIVQLVSIAALLAAALVKFLYWRFIDTMPAFSTAESATGLGNWGKVRLFEAPHTQENFLNKEMGFRVARKHAAKLRLIALVGGWLAPAALVLAGLALPVAGAIALAVVAALLGLGGTLVERWLFFAEAKHAVTLYYGADKV